jgi:HJR/Mrr/RecB family endonuclease
MRRRRRPRYRPRTCRRRNPTAELSRVILLTAAVAMIVMPQWARASFAVLVAGLLIGWFAIWRRRRAAYRSALVAFRWDEAMTPIAFEHHCADYLKARGWNARTTRASGDQGVDVIAEKSGVRVAIQCKKQASPVGNKAVQEVYTGMTVIAAHRAAVVSNNTYTPAAREAASATGVKLLHFTELRNADRLFAK